ncbi:carboxymuconolactone decarboxylase family protein [Ideonella sp. A 288]|uniref:carboxymuconolactone decarboxylase family protein n=1 Tax=Ideonella sp. A 288 TaxID=1962181 RepID=UPI000B4A5BD3|nr:carboxymuconolactone decarboxylase family protein [Ideonella sp. A 288]
MRVDPSPLPALPWYLKPFFRRQQRHYGQALTPALVWARVPPLYGALLAFYAAIERRGSPLSPVLRSLVQTRVSQLTHCAFCIDLNASIAAERAGSLDKALAVDRWRDDPSFDARERLALEYAEAMTESAGAVDDALATRLRAEFDEPSLIELTALIAFQNLSARFNAALDIPSQGLCRRPD